MQPVDLFTASEYRWPRNIAFILLFLLLFLLMGWMPWQQMQQELSQHKSHLLERLSQASASSLRHSTQQAELLAGRFTHEVQLRELLQESNTALNHEQQALLDHHLVQLQPLGVTFLGLVDNQGKRFAVAMKGSHREHFNTQSQSPLAEVNAAWRGQGIYHRLRLVNQGNVLGYVEFGFSHLNLLNDIQRSFIGSTLFTLKYEDQPYRNTKLHTVQQLPGISGFTLIGSSRQQTMAELADFVIYKMKLFKQALLQGTPAILQDQHKSRTLLFLPVLDDQGGYAANVLVSFDDPYISLQLTGFQNQILVGFLVLTLLMLFILWAHYQRHNVALAYQQQALALQGGQLNSWDYYPRRHLVKLGMGSDLDASGRLQTRLITVEKWLAGLHPDDRAQADEQLQLILAGEKSEVALEYRRKQDHQWLWYETTGKVVERDSKGRPSLISGVFRDISQQKMTAVALSQSEQKYRELFTRNKAVELIIDINDQGRIVDANEAAVKFYGYSREHLLAMRVEDINCLSTVAVEHEIEQAFSEQRSHFYFKHRLASGEVRDVEVHSGPVEFQTGHPCLYSIVHDITDRVQAQTKLLASEGRFASLFDCSIDGIVMVNSSGNIELCNPAAKKIMCWKDDIVGSPIDWSVFDDLDAGWLINQYRACRKGRTHDLRAMQVTRDDGVKIWLEVALSSYEELGQLRFVAILRNITVRKHQQQELERAKIAFENALEGIVVTDCSNQIVSVNHAVESISGYSRQELIGKTPAVFSSGQAGPEFYQEMWQSLQDHGCWQGEISNRHKSGRIYTEWLNINEVRDELGSVSHYVAVFSDISDLKASRERLDYLAHHDVLTGLPNRLVFKEQLEQAIKRSRRSNNPMAVLFIDLDRFKQINDNLGHDVGDELLVEISNILTEQVRETDTVVRLGGDEFSIIFENWLDMESLARRAASLIDRISKPIITCSGHELKVGASIGVSIYPQDAMDATTLVKYADIAMYRAKELGKGRFEFYSAEMTETVRQRFGLENALDEALDSDDQITTVYQPQINLQTGEICGLEALVRWHHPEQGVVGPDTFIPIAEDNGMIHRIGRQVTKLALRDIRLLREQIGFTGRMAINISVPELEQDGFADRLVSLCEQEGVKDGIELEVTETSLGRQPEKFFARLRALRDHGFPVAIDDFGTGHSTLARLKQCPSDYLKIDKTFIQDLPEDQDDLVIARSIMSLGQNLGQQVIAEGVETKEQALLLKSMGCDIGQGYYFSRPLVYRDVVKFLKEWQPFDQA